MAEIEKSDSDAQSIADDAMSQAQASVDQLKEETGTDAVAPDSAVDAVAPADGEGGDANGAASSGGASEGASGGAAGETSGGAPLEVPDLDGSGSASGGEGLDHRESGSISTIGAGGSTSSGIELLKDVDLHVTIELGRTQMLVEDVLRLGSGSVVELDKLAGDPVDVFVNHRLVARGEVLVLNDNFCIRISEIVGDLQEQAQQAQADAQVQPQAKAG